MEDEVTEETATPRRRYSRRSEPAVESAAADLMEAAPTESEPVAEPIPPEPEEPKSRDIGNWKFTPWHGLDMWSHPNGLTTFKPEFARKHRRL